MVMFVNEIWILGKATNMKFVELHMEHCFKATIQMEGVEFHAFELFPIGIIPIMYESNKIICLEL